MDIPKWVSPERQKYLADLFNSCYGLCIYGHTPCKGEFTVKRLTLCKYGRGCDNPTGHGKCIQGTEVVLDGLKYVLPCEVEYRFIKRWHCSYANHPCYNAIERVGVLGYTLYEGECHYEQYVTRLIKSWSIEDRLDKLDLKHIEDIAEHRTNDRTYPLHGRFSGIAQDIYYDKQPEYFIESLGFSALTFKRYARVRLASSPIFLDVTIENELRTLSKNARRKAVRYQHINPKITNSIQYACLQAVKDFKAKT